MKNKIILFLFLFCINWTPTNANEEFNFNITEIEVTNNGNFFRGLKRGSVITNDNQLIITANIFEYDKTTNILKAKGNVIAEDRIKDYIIKTDHITYYKNEERIVSKGATNSIISSKYKVSSEDVTLDRKLDILKSNKKTIIFDNKSNRYETDILHYTINENIFKGSNVKIFTNIDKTKNEKEFYLFKDGIFNLSDKNFVASDTKIYVKKNIFDEEKNDPRILGKSSKKIGNITQIKKAIFTS